MILDVQLTNAASQNHNSSFLEKEMTYNHLRMAIQSFHGATEKKLYVNATTSQNMLVTSLSATSSFNYYSAMY
ncbi:hypothetical protein EB796_019692 [Bugula neritina]|uniref:Uncharacterized protein n=1 Tax=Bugula neritina TaxID=10212 RepID=A0A7J7J7B4_BUGNE|nr:hypothetical protein EB796_019692 [Bugula neritina]